MNNPHQRRGANPNQLQPKKRGKGVVIGAVAASLVVGAVLGVAYSEANKADEIHAQESKKPTPKSTPRTTTPLPTTTTTTVETTQPTTTSITPETTNPQQGKEVIDPRDEKLRERAALFSGCNVVGLYDEGGNSLKLEISTSVNADNYHIRDAARKRGESIYGSGVAIYQTDKTGAIVNQTPLVRTEIGPGGGDHDAEHPAVTLPKQEGVHYEVSVTTGAAIGDKALVNAVACDVIVVKDGHWDVADVPAVSGTRVIS